MSELINNSAKRKAKLKELILKLHKGESEETVRKELLESLSKIPYGEVVEVEQELIEEGLPESEVLKLCDAHSAVLWKFLMILPVIENYKVNKEFCLTLQNKKYHGSQIIYNTQK